jgi:hypothetical protein
MPCFFTVQLLIDAIKEVHENGNMIKKRYVESMMSEDRKKLYFCIVSIATLFATVALMYYTGIYLDPLPSGVLPGYYFGFLWAALFISVGFVMISVFVRPHRLEKLNRKTVIAVAIIMIIPCVVSFAIFVSASCRIDQS